MESHAPLRPIYKYKVTPTFAHSFDSFAFQLLSELASTLHSPVALNVIQNTLAISAPGNDTIKTGTQLFNTETQ